MKDFNLNLYISFQGKDVLPALVFSEVFFFFLWQDFVFIGVILISVASLLDQTCTNIVPDIFKGLIVKNLFTLQIFIYLFIFYFFVKFYYYDD